MKKAPRHKSKHHRKPKANNGSDSAENISIVTQKKHRAYHLLFGTNSPHAIANILNDIWIDKEYAFVVRKRRPGIQW